ncbi:uncharacterized protein METZ01_LOCUS469720, partial [marine metagenome]
TGVCVGKGIGVGVTVGVAVGVKVEVGFGVGVLVGFDNSLGAGVLVGTGVGVAVTTISFITTSGFNAGFSSTSEQAANKTRITDIPNSRLSIIENYTKVNYSH